MISVVDSFLDIDLYNKIKNILSSNEFPWFYQENISGDNAGRLCDFGFFHLFVSFDRINSPLTNLIYPAVDKILHHTKTGKLLRLRADMTVYSSDMHRHQIHHDLDQQHLVSILYFTNSISPTVIFKDSELKEKQEILPKENRLIYFPGNLFHTGHSPIDVNRRILLNVNSI